MLEIVRCVLEVQRQYTLMAVEAIMKTVGSMIADRKLDKTFADGIVGLTDRMEAVECVLRRLRIVA